MAFDRDNLTRVGSGGIAAGSMWLYGSTDDAYAAIAGADYFLDAITELDLYDFILIKDSANVQKLSYIKTNNGTTITVAGGLTITA